jgi:curved DNA-binding protein CbpA
MTTRLPDLYAILGVAPEATQAEIGHAYRALLRRHHPDTRDPADGPPDAQSDDALQQVLAAYTILRSPTRRAEYDRQVRRRSPSAPPPAANVYRPYRQPPIVAGPVRWHRG